MPVVTQSEAQGIAKFLLSLRCNMKLTTIDRLDKNALWLPRTKLTLKGGPNWKRFLGDRKVLHTQSTTAGITLPMPRADEDLSNLPTHLTISCPTCGHSKSTTPARLVSAAR